MRFCKVRFFPEQIVPDLHTDMIPLVPAHHYRVCPYASEGNNGQKTAKSRGMPPLPYKLGDTVFLTGPVGYSLCVTVGSAYNQAGRSSGLTAPNGPAQTALVRGALQVAGKQPGNVKMISLHGTGTPLGDPIEVGALGPALAGNSRPSSNHITLGEMACIASLPALSRSAFSTQSQTLR